jgi:glycosyltransferase involved in cell wall biosynthesis
VRVCLLSLTTIADDPRVRRHGDALAEAGHEVVGLGFGGGRSPDPAWPVRSVAAPGPGRRRRSGVAARLAAVRAVPGLAGAAYWSQGFHRRLLEEARAVGADVYHANDWRVLPVAARAAEGAGGRIVYDSHEMAVDEYIESRTWRLLYPSYIRRIEGGLIGRADLVCTVAEGIAEAMREEYGLDRAPLVVRNVPPYAEMPHRPVGSTVRVLYHGAFHPARGLEELIASVARWAEPFRLVLRGFGAPAYEAALREQAARSPAADRIMFVPPAPMVDLVALANQADVGVFPLPATSRQTRFCLPNKFFEYVMAGLAICVSDVPEMARLVDEHDLGLTMTGTTPDAIAATINSLTPAAIDHFKARSLRAAHELCWDTERSRLLDAYDRLVVASS